MANGHAEHSFNGQGYIWVDTTVDKSVGKRADRNDAGEIILNAKTGKPRMVNDTVAVPFRYPVLNPDLDSSGDIAQAIEDIVGDGVPGYTTYKAVIAHLNYGIYTAPRNEVARGADVRHTKQQRDLIRTLGGLVRQGLMEIEVCVASLLRQGVSDAEAVMLAFVEQPDDGPERAAETTYPEDAPLAVPASQSRRRK